MPRDDLAEYPIAVLQDRYGGTYAGGQWLAVAQADLPAGEDFTSRVQFCLDSGPHGGDMEAMQFWIEPPGWIASGYTPDAAIGALKAKRKEAKT